MCPAVDGQNIPRPAELCTLARTIGVDAGALAESMRAEAVQNPDAKSTEVDLVTAADRAVEAFIISSLLASRPDDGIVGEEGGSVAGSSGVNWIVDPIDGTTNYVYGLPYYAVSIAAEVNGAVVAGVVVTPRPGVVYSATRGGGAFRNGEPIAVRTPESLAVSLVGTGFGYTPERRANQARVVANLLPKVRDIRRFGSAALDLCAVAEGSIDAYYERGLNAWDFAAGALIASEAGAVVSDLREGPASPTMTIAAAPTIASVLHAFLVAQRADDASGES